MSDVLTASPVWANFARAVSDLFSPPVMAVPALAVSAWYSQTPGTYWYALLYLGVGVLLPVLYVVWAIRTGRITDFHMAIRRERVAPFLVSILCGAAAWLMLVGLGAPRDFAAPVLALLLQTLLLFLITLFWQVSVHTAVTASLVTFCCMVAGQGALLLIGLIPLVAWARLYLGRHTLAQTVVGACVGVSCFALLFALHGIAW
jgi:membrane-associated phospholipid phosphatase